MAEGQVELFDPPATRRLIVPPGHTAWWGVDPSSRRVALAYMADGDARRCVITRVIPSRLDGGERLEALRRTAFEAAVETIERPVERAPGVIVVEQPSGRQPNPALSYAVGAIMAGLWAGVKAVTGNGVLLEPVSSSSWKKKACGSGAIYKPKPTERREYGVLVWARSLGYDGSSYDEVDAMGICEFARRTYALEPR